MAESVQAPKRARMDPCPWRWSDDDPAPAVLPPRERRSTLRIHYERLSSAVEYGHCVGGRHGRGGGPGDRAVNDRPSG